MTTDIYDVDVDYTIDETYGVGLEFEDDRGNQAVSVSEGLPRRARLTISTYTGTSLAAFHWYGALKISGMSFRYTKIVDVPFLRGDLETLRNVSGAYDRHKPREMLGLTIRLTRGVTAKEALTDRFEYFGEGEPTQCFDSREAVIEKGIAEFKLIFRGQWILVEGTTDEVLAGARPGVGTVPPTTEPSPPKEVLQPLIIPGRKRKKLTKKGIWERSARLSIDVEAVFPCVELEDGSSQGLVVFQAFATDVTAEDGQKLGSIAGGTGAVVINYTTPEGKGENWHIKHDDLWWAFVKARERK